MGEGVAGVAERRGVVVLVGTPEEIRSGRGLPVMTAAEVGAHLGVSEGRVRQWVAEGKLSWVAQFGKAHLFLERDVEALRLQRERTVAITP